jgi:putative Mn2+ efflux pump MntP
MGAASIKIAVLALALALDVFAVSVGVGVRGTSRGAKVRIGAAFAGAEIAMNLIGAGIGVLAGRLVGEIAAYAGFAALVGLGIYMVRESLGEMAGPSALDLSRGHGLFVASLAISLDSLGIGFTILYIGVPIEITLIAIGIASVASTGLGLTLGRWLGRFAERNAAFIGGLILALTGIAFAVLKALRIG